MNAFPTPDNHDGPPTDIQFDDALDIERIEGGVEPKLPITIVLDLSGSMAPVQPELERLLPLLGNAMRGEALIAQTAVTSIIGFASDAEHLGQRRVHLADSSVTWPAIETGDATNYDAALRLLRETIEQDVDALKLAFGKAYRPLVFFVTDGNPNVGGDWSATWSSFCGPDSGFRYRPNMVSIGLGRVNDSVLQELTNVKIAWKYSGVDATEFVKGLLELIFNTVVTELAAVASAVAPMDTPTPSGFIQLDAV